MSADNADGSCYGCVTGSDLTPLRSIRFVATMIVAGVWLHQGLWCKVLGKRPDHERIVATVPGVGATRARAATVAIGAAEVGLAVWVLTGRRPVFAARVQTLLLAAMNGGGLVFAAERIPAAARMLRRNTGFLAAVWTVAALRGRGRASASRWAGIWWRSP